jgi:hypothetical protein
MDVKLKVSAMDKVIPAAEFARNFGRYRDEAMSGRIVRVTSHGRLIGGFLSEAQLLDYERLRRREREVLRVDELDDETVAAIEAAEYGVAPE